MTDQANKLNCIVVDDEPLALSLLGDYIGKSPELNLVASYSDPLKALELIKKEQIDLVFLDMQMPELDGVQFMKILQKRCMVIITTAYSSYAMEGFEHHVVDYLLKPITLDRFMIGVEKAVARVEGLVPQKPEALAIVPAPSYLFVKTEYRIVKIELADIYYLEGARDYVIIHTTGEQILTLQSMKSLEEQLPATQFIRIHKSYLIAIGKINFIERGRVSINKQLIPVSDTYKERLLNQIKA